MRTNVDIDDKLMKAAMKASGKKTKRETIEAGLEALVERKELEGLLALRGKVTFDPEYLKEMRKDD